MFAVNMQLLHRRKPQNREEKVEPEEAPSGLQNDGYCRVPHYVGFIFVWAILVVAYVIVLERAVQERDFLGPRGSQRRTRSFDVLSFIRTGFASIHIPVIVSVLASTVPYWTTVDPGDRVGTEAPHNPSYKTINEVDSGSSVTQIFYMADRSWAGLIGWITTCYNGFLVARPSLLWLHLTVVVAVAYIGFPLLSVAYVVESSQYWVPSQFQAAAAVGGSNLGFEQALISMSDLSRWVGEGEFSAAPDHSNDLIQLSVFNSSQGTNIPFLGLSNQSAWASGNSVLTLGVGVSNNSQLPLAAVRVKAICRSAGYNNTILIPGYSIGPENDLAFSFVNASSDENWPLPYKLSCKKSCNATSNIEYPICFSNSSTLTMWPTNTTTSGYNSFEGQALTCGSISNASSTELGAVAEFQFAVNGPKAWTSVRTCELAVSYVRPTVNTFIGEYMESTTDRAAASTLQIPQGLTPAQLLQLSTAGALSLFHNGPPPAADGVQGVTDGFKWISWLADQGVSNLNFFTPETIQLYTITPQPRKREPQTTPLATAAGLDPLDDLLTRLGMGITTSQAESTSSIPSSTNGVHYPLNPWDLLQVRLKSDENGVLFDIVVEDVSFDGNSLYRPGYFNEEVFLKPLASIISTPEFFSNSSTNGVAFKTDLKLVHGRVPSILAIIVLMLPIFWTLMLAILSNRHKRWTGSLDAFAMFRLGGDWRDSLQHLRMASLVHAKKELSLIPGMVHVDAKESLVELTHPPKRVHNGDVAPVRDEPRRRTDSRGSQLPSAGAGIDEEQPIVATGRPGTPALR